MKFRLVQNFTRVFTRCFVEETRKTMIYEGMERNVLKIRSKVLPQSLETFEAVKTALEKREEEREINLSIICV